VPDCEHVDGFWPDCEEHAVRGAAAKAKVHLADFFGKGFGFGRKAMLGWLVAETVNCRDNAFQPSDGLRLGAVLRPPIADVLYLYVHSRVKDDQ
jgi:hypothetical protein